MKRNWRTLFSRPIDTAGPPCRNAAIMYNRMTGQNTCRGAT